MMSIYTSQYDDYQMQANLPDLPEEQKVILRDKKKVLEEVYPAIKLYVGYADSGVVPGSDLETLIVSRLNQLMMEVIY